MANFEKHVGKGTTINIDGDEYTLLPLTVKELPLFFKLIKAFKGFKPDVPIEETLGKLDEEDVPIEETLGKLDEESGEVVAQLISKTLKKSYPETDEELRDRFGLKYMGVLVEAIVSLNFEAMEGGSGGAIDKFMEEEKKKKYDKSVTQPKG